MFSKKGETKKESKIGKVLKEFFEKDKVKSVVFVLSWILVAFLIWFALPFIHHPLTFILFLLLAIWVSPPFNKFLKDKKVEIAFWKKFLVFFVVFVIILITAPIDEDGILNKGIEGIDFSSNGSGDTILNNPDLPVVSYGVNYYYDNVLTFSERYEANLYDVITFYEDKSQNGKYDLVTENNFPLEINSENLKDNIINIYYRTHKDNVSANNVDVAATGTTELFVTEDELQEGDVILEEHTPEVEWSEQVIESKTYEEVKDMLNSPVDDGTKNVVYTVLYVYDGEIDDSLTDYYVLPKGSVINNAPLKDKEGFVYNTTTNVPLTVNDNNEVVKVIYDKDKESTSDASTEETSSDAASTDSGAAE